MYSPLDATVDFQVNVKQNQTTVDSLLVLGQHVNKLLNKKKVESNCTCNE